MSALHGIAGLDYHTAELQKYRLRRELARARERGAMVRDDRRDANVMVTAEWDRAAKCAPVDRCIMTMEALAIYDRYREAKKLRLMREDERTIGRVWP